MTRVYGFANNPTVLVGAVVYASLIPDGVLPRPTVPNADETITDANGRWELDLQPTTGADNVYWRIRVWQRGTLWVDVPDSPELLHVDSILVPPPNPPTPPQPPGAYVLRTELEKPGGVATLDSAGILKAAQRPTDGGTGGGEIVDWFFGDGPPTVVTGAGLNDIYVDRLTGDLYQLT